jgi:ribonucleoside-triphosphate reductase
MDHYVDHNCSITIYYDISEIPTIVNWLYENWNSYVGVSFIYRTDPTKTAKDLGYPYLPQEVVTKEEYEAYVSTLTPVSFDAKDTNAFIEVDSGPDCSTGACPVR